MNGALALALVALGGCDKQGHDATPTPPSGSVTADASFTVSLRAVKVEAAGETPFAMRAAAHENDKLAYYLTADRDAFAYVLEYFPDGTRQVLYPESGPGVRLAKGADVRVPPNGRFFELYGCPGEENLYVVVSARALDVADPELATLVTRVQESPPAGTAACPGAATGGSSAPPPAPAPATTAIASNSAGAGAGTATATARPAPFAVARVDAAYAGERELFHSRGVELRPRAVKLGGFVYDATADARGVAVLKFPFQHLPAGAP